MTKIAIVGCGVVGGSWAIIFARAGHGVMLYDPLPASVAVALEYAKNSLTDLSQAGLLGRESVEQVLKRMQAASSLAEAVSDAEYVQESAPERVETKQTLYEDLARLTGENTILASSTSGLPASAFTEQNAARHRCIVVHPVNPPHLIPLVEIVPSPWTKADVVERTHALMTALGQKPISLRREVSGFVLNRLQGAVLAEAFRLVEDGVVSINGVDTAMTAGLAHRWFFMGPFETIDLNASGGIADYCCKLGPMYFGLAQEQADPRPWGEMLIADVESQRRAELPIEKLEQRQLWRDKMLSQLTMVKRDLLAKQW